tara:strand:+ start:297 stop:569 length:273 start_codon:yes stop_codon:yes gene_type:complete
MTINELINHHIEQAKLLNGLHKIALEEGRGDMNTTEMINYHTKRAVELRAREIVEARDREEPKWSVFIIFFVVGLAVGLVIGGAIAPLLL